MTMDLVTTIPPGPMSTSKMTNKEKYFLVKAAADPVFPNFPKPKPKPPAIGSRRWRKLPLEERQKSIADSDKYTGGSSALSGILSEPPISKAQGPKGRVPNRPEGAPNVDYFYKRDTDPKLRKPKVPGPISEPIKINWDK